MKISKVSISNYKCLNNAEIDCSINGDQSNTYQWTVLLGENNSGKTSLLKAIANLRPVKYRFSVLPDKDSMVYDERFKDSVVPSLFYDKDIAVSQDTNVNIVFSNDLGHDWVYRGGNVALGRNPLLLDFKIYAYGVSRYPSESKLSETTKDECISLYEYGRNLTNIEEWLMQLDYAAKSDQPSANNKLYKIKELLCGNLFPEIEDFIFESDGINNYTYFKTNDGQFRYTELGYGYQSMLSWVVDLCKKMFDRYPNSKNPLRESAVVLIDEIDLHLHPMWQREIIKVLSDFFTNTQFIVTTHSPTVIQSMDNVNLYVLKRRDNIVTVEKSSISNFRGWSVEEILRNTMDLENDVYSDEYQNNMMMFETGLDEGDKEKVADAYQKLCNILHERNPIRRLLKLQLSQVLDK